MAIQQTRKITILLNEDEYARLSAEAHDRGVRPDELAAGYIRTSMDVERAISEQEAQKAALDALEKLRNLREELREIGYPSVDAVELVRQRREELERRSDPLWSS